MDSLISDKLLNQCDDCGKDIKSFHLYKTKVLCAMCYRKYFMILSTPPTFEEPFSSTVGFSLSLTESQRKLLNDRLKYLFPGQKNCRVKYLRALVYGDIESWKRNEGNEKEESGKL